MVFGFAVTDNCEPGAPGTGVDDESIDVTITGAGASVTIEPDVEISPDGLVHFCLEDIEIVGGAYEICVLAADYMGNIMEECYNIFIYESTELFTMDYVEAWDTIATYYCLLLTFLLTNL